MIEVSHLTKRFSGRAQTVALHDVSFRIDRGETVAIVGPSGSGKSTLLNVMGCLDQGFEGEAFVDGASVSRLSDNERTALRRDKIGFIFQFFNLLPTLSCLENVGLPLHLRGWSRKSVHERAMELLQLVKLGDRVHHQPDQLSGGQRQRVAIARALALNPPILLADEPTGNLDSATGLDILALIGEVQRLLTSTVVIVTHDMNVARSCQRILTLRDGRLVDDVRRSAG